MALRDAFSRFLRKRAESQRDGDDGGQSSTALTNAAGQVDSGDDPDLVVLVERLEGYYRPETDEFVPTAAAVEIIEGYAGDDPKVLVRELGDAAPPRGETTGQQSTADQGNTTARADR